MISGNLTRDPELRRTQSGMAILSLGVAVNDRRRNPQSGEWEDYANFIDCTMFGNRGESLSNILTKGMKVAIEGKLRWSQWERDGQKRSKIEVIVDEIEFMSSRNGGQGGYQNNQGGYQQSGYNQGAYQQPAYQQSAPAQQYQQAGYQPAPAQQPYAPQAQAASTTYASSSYAGYEAPSQEENFGSAARGAYRDMPAAPTADAYADEDIPF